MYTMLRQQRHLGPSYHGYAGLGDAFSVDDVQNDIKADGCSGGVKTMQDGLNKLGYGPIAVDGVVGPATAAALTNFGINSNPIVNGNWCFEVGKALTNAAIASNGAVHASVQTQAPTSKSIKNIAFVNPNLLLAFSKGITKKPLQNRSGIVASAENWWTVQPTTTKVGVVAGGVAAVGLLAYLLI